MAAQPGLAWGLCGPVAPGAEAGGRTGRSALSHDHALPTLLAPSHLPPAARCTPAAWSGWASSGRTWQTRTGPPPASGRTRGRTWSRCSTCSSDWTTTPSSPSHGRARRGEGLGCRAWQGLGVQSRPGVGMSRRRRASGGSALRRSAAGDPPRPAHAVAPLTSPQDPTRAIRSHAGPNPFSHPGVDDRSFHSMLDAKCMRTVPNHCTVMTGFARTLRGLQKLKL